MSLLLFLVAVVAGVFGRVSKHDGSAVLLLLLIVDAGGFVVADVVGGDGCC